MKNLTKNELQLIVVVYRNYFTYPYTGIADKLSQVDLDNIYGILKEMTEETTEEELNLFIKNANN